MINILAEENPKRGTRELLLTSRLRRNTTPCTKKVTRLFCHHMRLD